MSRIDTSKSNAGAGLGPSSARISRALNRNETAATAYIAPSAPRPALEEADRHRSQPQTEDVSVSAIPEVDLAPLHAAGSDRLLGELCRIDLALASRSARSGDAGLREAIDVGRTMIGETVRRLRLLQSGQDALILKR